MNLVLDTNVLVASVSRKSPTRWLWDSFLREEYTIDNKFVDCAISANADFIVTHDKHFQELIGGEFPEVRVISISELSEELGKGG